MRSPGGNGTLRGRLPTVGPGSGLGAGVCAVRPAKEPYRPPVNAPNERTCVSRPTGWLGAARLNAPYRPPVCAPNARGCVRTPTGWLDERSNEPYRRPVNAPLALAWVSATPRQTTEKASPAAGVALSAVTVSVGVAALVLAVMSVASPRRAAVAVSLSNTTIRPLN